MSDEASSSVGRPISAEPIVLVGEGLFVALAFLGAGLLFLVQPMVTRLLLPLLGGAPAVWNTAMVFFQAALLAGYLYAHLLQRLASVRRQILLHLALLVLAGAVLPLHASGLFGAPSSSHPVVWLLGTLVLSIGGPFAVLSATAPLTQAWYARARGGGTRSPYRLYAASNSGSFLALVAYPVLVEPSLTLSAQTLSWTVGYGLFILAMAVLGLGLWRTPVPPPSTDTRTAPPFTWRRRIEIVLLAAAPSSLMLGVTAYLSTDVASAPFLWVLPLALYLLTFVIAFQDRWRVPLEAVRLVQLILGAMCLAAIPFDSGNWPVMFALNIAAFFASALLCHQTLADRRPPPTRLTEFYLLLSLGGVIGGAFTALVAPSLFTLVWEYPLVLVLLALVQPWGRGCPDRWEIGALVIGLIVCAILPFTIRQYVADPHAFGGRSSEDVSQILRFVLGGAVIAAIFLRHRGPMLLVLTAALALSAQDLASRYTWMESARSFFGVLRVAHYQEPLMGGEVRMLMHGTTLHGAEAMAPAYRCQPTLYYARSTPLGQATAGVQALKPHARLAVVGQGSGAMASYVRAGDALDYFEIDPLVNRLSRDPARFRFISTCAQGPVNTIMGDARLNLNRQPARTYDLLIVDAFTSDAVPTHLLTREAIAGYLRVVKPDGIVVLHLSNRNLEITQPTVAAARSLGAPYLHQVYLERAGLPAMAEASTEAVILSPTPEGLRAFVTDPRWHLLMPTRVRPWTDDYVDLFGALTRQIAADWRAEHAPRRRHRPV